MKYGIDLHPIYECSSCTAIVDEKDIVITLHIRHCPVCGNESLVLIKLS